MKAILLLCEEPQTTAGTRETEKFPLIGCKKLNVTIKGSPNNIFSNGFEAKDFWEEARRYFNPAKIPFNTPNMDYTKYYTGDKLALLVDLRYMEDQTTHGSGMELLNGEHGIFLELERDLDSGGEVHCHVFVIADSQMNIKAGKFHSVQYN